MKATVKIKKKVGLKTLHVKAGARYWEDTQVNGVEDTEGNLIPFRDGKYWKPVINLDSGQIIDWPEGTTAVVHYKVCDNGFYEMKDESGITVLECEGYVPKIMSPKESGYGDYVIMDIDENGFIQNWKPTTESFVKAKGFKG